MDAEAWLAAERRSIERDEWIAPAQRVADRTARAVTVAEYADNWVEHRNVKPRTRSMYRDLMRLHITPTLGRMPLKNVTPETVRVYLRGWELSTCGEIVTPTGFCMRSAPRRSLMGCWQLIRATCRG
ncbi:hypothetical protein [Mycolicibacterium fortuitum]|nr:hypothetical protein [Mycolicibacterium fortuitum]